MSTEIVFRGMERSPALEATARSWIARLDRAYDRIVRCSVVIELPHRHQRSGHLFQARIELVIPERVITRPPSAELRPDQKDSDSLPPYEVLDAILERFIEGEQSQAEIIASGFDEATVRRVAKLVLRSEYKRRQSAPGPKISTRAFGRDRRYPISSGWN